MTHHPWEVLKSTVIHDALPWVKLSSEHVRLPNGVEIQDFYRVEIHSYVTLFPVRADGQVALVEHYKHGPQVISLELPAGYIDAGETPLEAAQRELAEETGLVSEDWMDLGRYFIDGNRGGGWSYGFLARNAYQAGQPQPEDTELMTIHYKSLEDVYRLWRANHIMNAVAMGLIGRCLLELDYMGPRND